MPRGDGTGPMAMGAGTGRGLGYCSGADAPGFAGAPGRGGWWCGGGQGFRGRGGSGSMGGRVRGAWRQGAQGFQNAPGAMMGPGPAGAWQGSADPQQERSALQQQVMTLESNLAAIKARLDTLEKEPAEG